MLQRDGVRITLVTDAWLPQTNGVVTTLKATLRCLTDFGHDVTLITPEGRPTLPCPTYPEIRLALFQGRAVADALRASAPDAIHIATEGPLGWAARRAARVAGLRFTTSYHTQFPEYISARFLLPKSIVYAYLRHFHAAASCTMVGTRDVRRDLRRHGFRRLAQWTRGVDTQLFRPLGVARPYRTRPILIYAGRVAVEKNVEAFCRLRTDAEKLVVGGGPQLAELTERYPEVQFLGFRHGPELAAILASADCFVFPSRTDTFGLVMLEAMACGLPVAAFPVTGPIDVVREGESGCLREDLDDAVEQALKLDPRRCRAQALEYRWEDATRQFLGNLVDAPAGVRLVKRRSVAAARTTPTRSA
jgi:glycosyltransferase involved in cell wall biosynthesis